VKIGGWVVRAESLLVLNDVVVDAGSTVIVTLARFVDKQPVPSPTTSA